MKIINKAITLGLLLTGLGVISLLVENTFYQYIDRNGVLHESLFLPLGIMSIGIGMLVFIILMVQQVYYWLNKN
jgi:hypothetical protein